MKKRKPHEVHHFILSERIKWRKKKHLRGGSPFVWIHGRQERENKEGFLTFGEMRAARGGR